MPLELIKPGARKNNKFYLIRGMEGGVEYEVSTRTTDQRLAQRFLGEFKQKITTTPSVGRHITFKQVAEQYRDFRKLQPEEIKRLDKVIAALGPKRIVDIV